MDKCLYFFQHWKWYPALTDRSVAKPNENDVSFLFLLSVVKISCRKLLGSVAEWPRDNIVGVQFKVRSSAKKKILGG